MKWEGKIDGIIAEVGERTTWTGGRRPTYYQDIRLQDGTVLTLVNRFELASWAVGKPISVSAGGGRYDDATQDDRGRIRLLKGAKVSVAGKPLPHEAPGGEPSTSGPAPQQQAAHVPQQQSVQAHQIVAHINECQKIACVLAQVAADTLGCKIDDVPESVLITGNQVVMTMRDAGIILGSGEVQADNHQAWHHERQAEITDDDIPF